MGDDIRNFNNSYKHRTEQEKIPQMPAQQVTEQDKTVWQEFKEIFMPRSVKEVGKDVLLHNIAPNLKNGIANLLKNAIDSAWSIKSTQKPSNNGTVYATGISGQRNGGQPYWRPVFQSYDDARRAFNDIVDMANEGKTITVADIWQEAGKTPQAGHWNWGWCGDIIPEPKSVDGGYVIPLDAPKTLK